MRKTLIIIVATLAMLFFAPVSHADPILTCDPQVGVTHHRLTASAIGYDEISTAKPDTTGNHDLATFPEGEHQVEFRAGRAWTINGISQDVFKWGEADPFLLGNPETPGNTAGREIVSP